MVSLSSVCIVVMMLMVPPGIQNSGNICFASSVLQCLFNQKLFRAVLHDLGESHNPGCRNCKQGNCVHSFSTTVFYNNSHR